MMTLGDRFETPFEVTGQVYNGFMQTFADRNPLHTDEAFAREKGFAGKVMYGNILNGFVSYFVGECLPVKNVAIQHQLIKFGSPVYLHDSLVMHAHIAEVYETVHAYLFKFYFQNAAGVKVARGEVRIGLLS
jgi:3-hydroxybutyryl-CoA dehydratase